MLLLQVIWAIFILTHTDRCFFTRNFRANMRLFGLVKISLLIRIVFDPILAFVIDKQVSHPFINWKTRIFCHVKCLSKEIQIRRNIISMLHLPFLNGRRIQSNSQNNEYNSSSSSNTTELKQRDKRLSTKSVGFTT